CLIFINVNHPHKGGHYLNTRRSTQPRILLLLPTPRIALDVTTQVVQRPIRLHDTILETALPERSIVWRKVPSPNTMAVLDGGQGLECTDNGAQRDRRTFVNCAQKDDAMQMVGHHDKGVQLETCEAARQRSPMIIDHAARLIQTHDSIDHCAEPAFHVMHADGYPVRSG
ncbi:MAG: hypothetical protein WKF63_06615, partial [Thermomicrobiales bacterium]